MVRWRPGRRLGPVDLLGQRPQQDVVDQGRLARAGHAGDRHQPAEGEVDVDVVQVVLAGALDDQAARRCPAGGAAGRGWTWPPRGTGRSASRDWTRGRPARSTGPEWTIRPPCSPAPGPDVDHVVGHPDGLLVVLDHDDRVAQVAQALRASRSGAGCPAGGGRWTARPGRRGPRPGRCRSGWPGGSAGPRRPTGWRPSGPGSGSRGPRPAGTASAPGPRGRPGRR